MLEPQQTCVKKLSALLRPNWNVMVLEQGTTLDENSHILPEHFRSNWLHQN